MRSGAFSFACHDVVVMHQPALEREDAHPNAVPSLWLSG
jgi:hypothetical protein